ncbi:DeoR/GlpR family DNA-binding transcription regulator [Falsirhodobacter sp. alg1]|uniref:DeoR/GlpR family DNA-binding transcription regulator n=1 Tax=Falsirhodobacter sp. alg1 TaxID=1472418 RepID=UPI0005F04E50|nr:DeoR/GlpR family DNA-binding transcription regulator [Falsirhodobacter sp. alg1]
MHPRDRHTRIVEYLDRHGSVSVEVLAEALGSSRETIRRDLAVLDDRGLVRKIHGGARRAAQIPEEASFDNRMFANVPEKRRIAQAAARLFVNGDALFLDAGSTSMFFAERLAALSNLTVITNAAGALRHLGGGGNRVFLLGGEYEAAAQETLGAITEADLRRYRPEHVVLTVGAVQEDAVLDFDLREASLSRAMIAQARKVTVLADHAKFRRPAVFAIADLARVDRLVTDRAPDPAMARALANASVQVIVAQDDPPLL